MTRLLLIRHGLTDAVGHHLAGIAPGTHLNDVGLAQVASLVARLHDVPLTAIVSSPLERTRETAEPIANDHALTVEIVPELIEYDVGAWTDATFATLQSDATWLRFNRLRSLTQPERGESMLDVQHRAVEALLDLWRRHRNGNVAVVSH